MNQENCISLEAEINSELHKSLQKYLDYHPYWDINRVLNASLSLFMMQNWRRDNGLDQQDSDTCTRIYLDSIFHEYYTHRHYEQNS
ncbi:DUF2811 domain-containing protein [Pleurocapsales cyanobacterium LEGE 10410]|nr:DUF2811 domain-containing protein [Pleurocapsales cyanobacterium LEGE 10410]